MSDARKAAEEALRRWDLCDPSRFHELRDELEGVYACADDMAHALRALLAEQPEAEACPDCGGAGWIPAGDEQLGCIRCSGTGRDFRPAPSPASDEVTQRNRARAEHILNHYDRRSKEDTFALARRLDADDAALSRGSKPASDEVLEAAEIAESAPELNLNNYDHEQVRELNDAMVAVTLKLRAALASERAARVAAERERDEARDSLAEREIFFSGPDRRGHDRA